MVFCLLIQATHAGHNETGSDSERTDDTEQIIHNDKNDRWDKDEQGSKQEEEVREMKHCQLLLCVCV